MTWPLTPDCSAAFEQLFAHTDRIGTVPIEVQSISAEDWAQIYDTFTYHRVRTDILSDPAQEIRTLFYDLLLSPGLFPAHRALRMRVDTIIGELEPIPAIRSRIDAFRRAHFAPQMIGVHLRLGDRNGTNTHATALIKKALDAVAAITAEHPAAQIFLSSDDGAPFPDGRPTVHFDVAGKFRTQFGSRVTVTEPRSTQRWKSEAIEDAMVDLYLLRACDFLIGTNQSSFSMLASYGTPAISRMLPVDPPPPSPLRRALAALGGNTPLSRFAAKHRTFGWLLWTLKSLNVRLRELRSK